MYATDTLTPRTTTPVDKIPTTTINYRSTSPETMRQTEYPSRPEPTSPGRPESTFATRMDQTRYWVGAVLTAVIAALASVVGLLVAHQIGERITGKGLILPGGESLFTSGTAVTYALSAAAITLVAAGLYAAMLRLAPRPGVYYGWVVGLVTVLALLVPFTTTMLLGTAVAVAVINLVIGLVVITLVPVAASNARATR